MLCLALATAFHGAGSPAAKAVEQGLGGTATWALDEEVLAAATGVLGRALSGREADEGEGEEESEEGDGEPESE